MTARNEAKIEITASTARLPAGLRSALKQMQGFVAQTTGLMNKTPQPQYPQQPQQDRRAMQRGVFWGGVASNLATRGIDVMVNQTREVFTFNDELMRLGVAGRIGKAGLDGVAAAARAVSNETGLSALEALRGGRAYLDLAGAQAFTAEKMTVLARVAQATNSDSKDLAGVMYQLTESMGITSATEMEATLGGLANQAKDGAIEMREMSKEFAGLMPLAKRFGMTGREGAIQVGALYQTMRSGFNTSAEAATGLERILAGIPSHASKFEKAGVKIWNVAKDGTKTLRTWPEIFQDIQKSELMKDPEKLKKSFGRTEGWRGFMLLVESLQKLSDLTAAGERNGVIAEDLATVTSSAMGRIDIAVEKLKNHFADLLTPARVEQIVGGIASLAAAMGPVLDAAMKVAGVLGTLATMARMAKQSVSRTYKFNLTDEEYSQLHPEQRDAQSLEMGGYYTGPDEQSAIGAQQLRNLKYGSEHASEVFGDIQSHEAIPGVPGGEALARAYEAILDQDDVWGARAGQQYLKNHENDVTDAERQTAKRLAQGRIDERNPPSTSTMELMRRPWMMNPDPKYGGPILPPDAPRFPSAPEINGARVDKMTDSAAVANAVSAFAGAVTRQQEELARSLADQNQKFLNLLGPEISKALGRGANTRP